MKTYGSVAEMMNDTAPPGVAKMFRRRMRKKYGARAVMSRVNWDMMPTEMVVEVARKVRDLDMGDNLKFRDP